MIVQKKENRIFHRNMKKEIFDSQLSFLFFFSQLCKISLLFEICRKFQITYENYH